MHTETTADPTIDPAHASLREQAIQRIRARRAFLISAGWFVLINAMLVYIWSTSGGFFWPLFPILFWGIGLVWQAIDLFGGGMSEERIEAEMRRLGGAGR